MMTIPYKALAFLFLVNHLSSATNTIRRGSKDCEHNSNPSPFQYVNCYWHTKHFQKGISGVIIKKKLVRCVFEIIGEGVLLMRCTTWAIQSDQKFIRR